MARHSFAARNSYFAQAAWFAVVACTLVLAIPVLPVTADPANQPASIGESRPIGLALDPGTATGGAYVSETVTVNQAGGTVLLGCDRPDLVAPQSGSWPISLSFSGTQTSQTTYLATAAVSATSTAHLFTYPAGSDPANPANWTTSASLTLTMP